MSSEKPPQQPEPEPSSEWNALVEKKMREIEAHIKESEEKGWAMESGINFPRPGQSLREFAEEKVRKNLERAQEEKKGQKAVAQEIKRVELEGLTEEEMRRIAEERVKKKPGTNTNK